MTPVQFERQDPMAGHLPAIFFMKECGAEGFAGYSLGIEVRDWWWEKVRDSCVALLAVDTNPLTGSVELTLATLSLSEFDIYRDLADRWTDQYILKTKPRIRKQRDEHWQKLGWKDKKSKHVPGLGTWPESIEHKYFTVAHREI